MVSYSVLAKMRVRRIHVRLAGGFAQAGSAAGHLLSSTALNGARFLDGSRHAREAIVFT